MRAAYRAATTILLHNRRRAAATFTTAGAGAAALHTAEPNTSNNFHISGSDMSSVHSTSHGSGRGGGGGGGGSGGSKPLATAALSSVDASPTRQQQSHIMRAARGTALGLDVDLDEVVAVVDDYPRPAFDPADPKFKGLALVRVQACAMAPGDIRVIRAHTGKLQGPPSLPYVSSYRQQPRLLLGAVANVGAQRCSQPTQATEDPSRCILHI